MSLTFLKPADFQSVRSFANAVLEQKNTISNPRAFDYAVVLAAVSTVATQLHEITRMGEPRAARPFSDFRSITADDFKHFINTILFHVDDRVLNYLGRRILANHSLAPTAAIYTYAEDGSTTVSCPTLAFLEPTATMLSQAAFQVHGVGDEHAVVMKQDPHDVLTFWDIFATQHAHFSIGEKPQLTCDLGRLQLWRAGEPTVSPAQGDLVAGATHVFSHGDIVFLASHYMSDMALIYLEPGVPFRASDLLTPYKGFREFRMMEISF